MSGVITRFPPSPTGFFHIGSARTALFNYLYTTHEKGTMFFRFEDTDRERSKKEFEEDIFESLQWLGISYTLPSIVRQSERTDVYKKHFSTLVEKGLAYEAEESKDNPGKKVIRFKNPNTKITFTDLIRGEVTFDTTELGEFVIARSMDEPLYHLAVVIDDHEMGVTHVIRGEDHISNTPRQILILEALGFSRPLYAHIPLILAPDKTKLSKRHGATSINEYRAQGFLPEAIVNYLALLGWNPGDEQEVFTLAELCTAFSFDKVQKSGAVFDIEKLKWFNHEHIKRLSDGEFKNRLIAFMEGRGDAISEITDGLVPLIKERSQTFVEAADSLANDFEFLATDPTCTPELLLKGAKADAATAASNLEKAIALLDALNTNGFSAENVKEAVFPFATEAGRSAVLWPMRVALSGKEKSPDPFTLGGLLGKDKTLKRLRAAVAVLK
jgi:glutamyl-tRNA synthetase